MLLTPGMDYPTAKSIDLENNMTLDALRSSTSTAQAAAQIEAEDSSAFREADFMAIMLAELSNQDPFEPAETAKLVENAQKLQELSNTRFERYRNDLRWAQDLIGKEVTVSQNNLSETEAQVLRDRGLNPDVGFGIVEGEVASYRTIGENVWINVDDKDYKIDNVQRIDPEDNIDQRIDLAQNLNGYFVSFSADTAGEAGSGTVSDVQWDEDGDVFVTVGGKFVPYENITSIGVVN